MQIRALSLIASIVLTTLFAYVFKALDLEQQAIGSC